MCKNSTDRFLVEICRFAVGAGPYALGPGISVDFPEDHPRCDSFGAFTMLLADAFTYEDMIHAMETREMYSSVGPEFREVSLEENRIHIECSGVKSISVFVGSKRSYCIHGTPDKLLASADFEIDDRARYVRVSIVDPCGNAKDTRGYFRNELTF